MNRHRILLVAAHADDEVLGAGGTLAAAGRAGAAVRVVALSVDSTSRDVDPDTRHRLKEHRVAAAQAAADLGGWSLAWHDYPDNAFDAIGSLGIAKTVAQEVLAFAPTVVLTHFPGDLSRDHQITANATAAATRPTGNGRPAALAFFEIRSSTEWAVSAAGNSFRPTLWVPLDAESWQVKLRSLALYADELRAWPHPRSVPGVEAQARYRGSEIGVDLAEAFHLARGVAQIGGSGACSG